MTLGFGSFTLGLIMILSAIRNSSVADFLLAKPYSQPEPLVANIPTTDSVGIGGSGAAGGGAPGAPGSDVAGPAVADSKFSKKTGVTGFDGHLVCSWIVPYLQEARRKGWKGHVTSGFRTVASNKAAGGVPNSNHLGTRYPSCAIDVSGAPQLAQIFRQIGAPLRMNPTDTCHGAFPMGCHFSANGS